MVARRCLLRRWLLLVAATLAAVLMAVAPAAPAFAHTVGGVGATNFRTTLSDVSPSTPGVSLTVIENGSRLQLSNDTSADVVVAGYGGEPYARVGPTGVWVNDNSPATYLNTDRFSSTLVPAGVDGKSAPVWRKASDEPIWRWHDHRVHWMLQSLPPAVAADPGSPHRISSWTVVLEYEGRRLTATGTLDWVPGPQPWPWFALAIAGAAAVVGAAFLRRPHRVLAAATAALVALDLAHGVGVMLVVAGTTPERLAALFGSDALLIWPFAAFAALLLWQGHTRAAWLSAVVGMVTAINLAVDDGPALWRSSTPTALPFAVNRATVAIVVGMGLGLVVALPLLLRRHRPPARPWPAAAAEQPAKAEPAEAEPAEAEPAEGPAEAEPAEGPAEGPAEAEPAQRPAEAEPAHVRAGTEAADGPVEPEPAQRPAETVPAGIGRRQAVGYLAAGALGAFAGATAGVAAAGPGRQAVPAAGVSLGDVGARAVPFFGERQAGIATPPRPQAVVWLAGFDLEPGADATALRDLLRRWTDAAARLTAGRALGETDDSVTAGLGPAALTITVGFGPSLFGKAGVPVSARPEALTPLPPFAGEHLDPARGDGDLGVVMAADDPVVVAHAARALRRLAGGAARLRWQMSGFNAARGAGSDSATPRNLMGHIDGTNNPQPADPDFAARVFVGGQSDPAWLRGGSYLVVRRIRMLLDDWDGLALADQERVIGRRKDSGAPLSGGEERTAANFGAQASDGSPMIPVNAHMRLAAPAFNEGAAILRRGFSYVDGDESGLLFLAWQADPRRGFIPVQRRLVESDALSAFIRHETSALFAMPGGAAQDGYVGRPLLEGA